MVTFSKKITCFRVKKNSCFFVKRKLTKREENSFVSQRNFDFKLCCFRF
jgi:hypothetical protein